MRKPLSILIVLALTAALFAGCGNGGNESSQNEESSSSVSSS